MLFWYKEFEFEIDERNYCDLCDREEEVLLKKNKNLKRSVLHKKLPVELNQTISIFLDEDHVCICKYCLLELIQKMDNYYNNLENKRWDTTPDTI